MLMWYIWISDSIHENSGLPQNSDTCVIHLYDCTGLIESRIFCYNGEMWESGGAQYCVRWVRRMESEWICNQVCDPGGLSYVIWMCIFFSIGSKTKFSMLLIPTLVSVCITETIRNKPKLKYLFFMHDTLGVGECGFVAFWKPQELILNFGLSSCDVSRDYWQAFSLRTKRT